ncbi:CD284 [Mytilus edulis]|uniref:TLR4 n=1 Tax=Mytilus edulis TaxID=6550 RepID=A0A8S3UQZ4_MYTED|nr:CD284 [Mytilus edulis]
MFVNLTRIDISLNNGNRYQEISNYDHESVYKKNQADTQLYVVDSRKSNINNSQFSKGADYVIGVPISLEFINASFIQTTTHSPNSIDFKGSNSLQLIDFAGTSFHDCNYTMNGLQSLKILNVSNFKCDILNYRFINSLKPGRIINHDHNNQHSQYDAYVAYHDDDYKWVVGPLRKYLESMGNFKLVLRHRDFLSGPSISNNIMDAIDKSKKVIVVISNGFLGGEWGEFELDRGIERFKEKASRIIVIRLEYLKKGELPSCLLQIWDKLIALDANDSIRNIELLNDKQVFWKCLNKAKRC